MKKKLLVIVITLVLAASLLLTAACDLFSKNKERDFSQVSAKVSYAGRNSQVTKLELNSSINTFLLQVYQYYGSDTYQTVLESIDQHYKDANESLAESEAYTLKCIDEMYKLVQAKAKAEDATEEDKQAAKKAKAASTVGKAYNMSARIKEIESLLSLKDMIAAVEAYNEDLQTGFDSFREAYEKELANATATTKSTENIESVNIVSKPWKLTYEVGEEFNEVGLEVSVTYKGKTEPVTLERNDFTLTGFDSSAKKKEQEITVTFGEKTATFNVEIVAALPSRPAQPKEDEEADEEKTEIPVRFEKDIQKQIDDAKAAKDSELYKVLKEAKRRFEKQMAENYRTYDYYYLSALKTQVVSAYEEILEKSVTEVSAQDVLKEYEKKKESQLENLLSEGSDYFTTVNGSSVTSQIVHEDGKVFYVECLLLAISEDLEATYQAFVDEKTADEAAKKAYHEVLTDKTYVYISNVDYDKDAECEEEECTCTACENYKGENPGACTDENCTCEKCPNKRFVNDDFVENVGNYVSNGDFALDMNKVDENNLVNILEMVRAIYADLGTVGTSDADRAAMLEKFEKWIYMVNDDEDTFSALSSGKLGIALDFEQAFASEDKDFLALARALADRSTATEEQLDLWDVRGTDVGSYGFVHTKDGICIVMLTGYALPEKYADDDYKIENTDLYQIPEGAVTNYREYEEAEEENELAKGTLAYDIKETLGSNAKSEVVANFKKAFYQEEMKKSAKITYYKDVYEDLVEEYKEK